MNEAIQLIGGPQDGAVLPVSTDAVRILIPVNYRRIYHPPSEDGPPFYSFGYLVYERRHIAGKFFHAETVGEPCEFKCNFEGWDGEFSL